MKKLPYGESINYWKTSRSGSDIWIDRAKAQIEKFGGKVLAEGFGSNAEGRAAFMIGFQMDSEKFKAVWPVLPTEYEKDQKAARVQAATLLYHDVKGKCISASVLGARTAFFSYLMLPDGRTAIEATEKELT